MPKLLAYIHTPPRIFTDQFTKLLQTKPRFLHSFFFFFRSLVFKYWRKGIYQIDVLIANSKNIQTRVKKYLKIEVDEIIFPAVKTSYFKFLGQGYKLPKSWLYEQVGGNWQKKQTQQSESQYCINGENLQGKNYFLSFARLENLKRIPLLVDVFAELKDLNLVICSSGPLENWLIEEIENKNLKNIVFEGRVSQERLKILVGYCLAGIYIPIDEDAGITQCEIMAAGKPVIGAKEGGLIETILENKTGWLIEVKNDQDYLSDVQIKENLKQILKKITVDQVLKMKKDCQEQAQKFDERVFFERLNQVLLDLIRLDK